MDGSFEPYISDPIMSNKTNEICKDTELSLQQSELLKSFTWWVQVGGYLPVGMVGFVLNSIAQLVLSTPSMRGNFFNLLLIVLAIFDNLYLSCEISEVLRHRLRAPAYEHQYIFANVIYPVRSIFMYCSILMTMASPPKGRNKRRSIIRARDYLSDIYVYICILVHNIRIRVERETSMYEQ